MIGTSKAKTFNKNLTDGNTDTYFATRKQQQKLPESKKSAEWFAKNCDYFIDNSIEFSAYYDKLRKLYRIAQGILNQDEYKYITEPHEGFDSDKRSFPARLRNYDIISPILNLLRGEKSLRPFPYQVYVHNHDAETEQKKAINEAIAQSIMDKVLFDMQQAGIPVNGPEGPPPPPPEIAKKIKSTWSDKRAKMGQDALNFLMDDQEVKDKWKEGFYDWLVTDYVFSYKDVIRDNVEYEMVPPYEISYVGSRETKFIEDCEAVVRRKLMTTSEIIDRFYDVLTEDEIDILEEDNNYHEHKSWNLFEDDSAYDDRNQKTNSTEKEVFHVVWKSLVKRGRLETSDIYGNPMEYEVDEHFKPRPDEKITWYWVTQVMEAYRIDGRFYKEMRPIPHQRGTMDNPSKCKLPYNGLCYSPKHVRSVSMVEKMIPYQILYNIIKFRLEVTMAKNKDKITPFPVGLVPDREGWDLFTSMYYADATGYMFYDETNKNAIQAMQYMKVLDASLNQYISFVHDYLKAIKEELEEFVGITRQRKGQTSASEGVGATQQSIFQSSVITEELFASYEEFQRRELQGFLDISKVAWIKGKRGQYVGDDMKVQFFNIEPEQYAESEFGVFVRTSKQEKEKLDQLRSMAQAFAQNQMRPSMVADILNSENFLELKGRMQEMEELEMQLQQASEQAPAQAEQAKLEFQAAEAEKQRQHEARENEMDRNLEREKMLNETNRELFASDINQNNVSDALEVNKLNIEMQDKQQTHNIKQQEVEVKKEQNDIKREEIKSKERIAKDNNKTKLKNPVVGEKKKK